VNIGKDTCKKVDCLIVLRKDEEFARRLALLLLLLCL